MISSAPRQPSMIRIRLLLKQLVYLDTTFSLILGITVSVFLFPASSNK